MKATDLTSKIVKAVAIVDSDAVYAAFREAVLNVQHQVNSEEYQHPMVKLVEQTFVLDALAGSSQLIQEWTRKFNNVPCLALVNTPPVEDEIEVDPLGYFYNTKDLVKSLVGLGCDRQSIEAMIAKNDGRRNSTEMKLNSCICINKESVRSFCAQNNLDLAATIEITLWHEIGHLVFNPSLYKHTNNVNIAREAPDRRLDTRTGNYKRSKPFQFAVEGLAEWFAFHAKDWSKASATYRDAANLLFTHQDVSPSEYSYFLFLNRIRPEYLVNIVLSFYFNCIRSGLYYLPVDENNETKLIPSDFLEVEYQGKDLLNWSSYGLYILGSMKDRRISTLELVRFSSVAGELVPFSRLDAKTVAFIGLQKVAMKFSQVSPVPSEMSTYNSAAISDFDDYMISRNEVEVPDLLIGLRFDGYCGQLLGISNFEYIRKQGTSWWIAVTFMKEVRKVVLLSDEISWKKLTARRSAFFSWLEVTAS